ncbi:hypothetical protein NMG60_11033231 [Bertholletia excelsa]
MGEKQRNNDSEKKSDDQQKKKKKDSEGGKKGDELITVVLKVDLHCEGCASKIKKRVRCFGGVESVKGGDDSDKLTIIGKVDPVKIRELVEETTKRKVDLVSPSPKKDRDNLKKDKDKDKDKDGGGGAKKTQDKPEKKSGDKKPKEPPVTTAVMKMNLHCQGCIQKIRKTVRKTKGYHDMSIDEQKNLVTVKGAMDMKNLAETLEQKLKKQVEIVPPAKDGGEKKEKGGGGEKRKDGEEGKAVDGDRGKGKGVEESKKSNGGGNSGEQGEENRVFQYVQYGYLNPYVYGCEFGYPVGQYHVHAPQMFSDENPNACSVM